jgi:hypothetical protein
MGDIEVGISGSLDPMPRERLRWPLGQAPGCDVCATFAHAMREGRGRAGCRSAPHWIAILISVER